MKLVLLVLVTTAALVVHVLVVVARPDLHMGSPGAPKLEGLLYSKKLLFYRYRGEHT